MVAASIQVLASALQGIPVEVDCIAAWSQGVLISGYGCRWKALGSEIAHKIAPVYALFSQLHGTTSIRFLKIALRFERLVVTVVDCDYGRQEKI